MVNLDGVPPEAALREVQDHPDIQSLSLHQAAPRRRRPAVAGGVSHRPGSNPSDPLAMHP